MLDDDSEWAPPDSIPNSEVKLLSADGSVVFRHVRVGHRQAHIGSPGTSCQGFLLSDLRLDFLNSRCLIKINFC